MCCKSFLSVLICGQSREERFLVRRSYPGILYGCQMDFVKDWPQYALEGEASHYLERHDVLPDISEQTRYLFFFLHPARFKKIDLFLLNSN